jgi:glycine/D-amino acid oxidase-like deaminating enzyme
VTAKTYDVIIAGAGIIGAACAAELSEAGQRVALVEGGTVGSGVTGAGMGHLGVLDGSDAQFVLTKYSMSLWHAIAPELSDDCEYDPCGILWIAADEEDLALARRRQEYYEAQGVSAQMLDAQALAEAEPHLREGLVGALLIEGDSVLYPPCTARYLAEKAQGFGATVLCGQRIRELTGKGAQLEDGGRLSAGQTINAAGAAANELTPGLSLHKRKGHLIITDRYPGFIRHQIAESAYLRSVAARSSSSVAFNVQPRKNGQVLIGSSRQADAQDGNVEPEVVRQMVSRAAEYMPDLPQLSAIRAWTGSRIATPDGLPYIGPWPEQDGLHIAAGLEGLGITMALAVARLLADQMLGRTPAISPDPFLPTRAMGDSSHG